ncbi:MAG: HK97 family phage prohead protease [Gammaproteobacteria bacterium]|nr:HK97 family phage prohead protease [Gammaproteobacteria bacterium]
MIESTPLFQLKRAPTAEGEFSGYASVFGGPPDLVGDVIAKGAFADAIQQHKSAGTRPAMLWSHDHTAPIGVWTELTEDAHGLLVSGRLTLGTARAREAHALLQDGAVSLSIGFSLAPFGARERGGIREITKVARLPEISLVAMPANTRARVTSVKSKPTNPREFEHFLRDAGGFSSREAKAVVSAGWRGLSARDERTPLDLVLDRIEQLQRSIEELQNAR